MSIYVYLYGEVQHWAKGGGILPARLRLAVLTLFWGSALYRWYFRHRHVATRPTARYSASAPMYRPDPRNRHGWQDYRAPWTPTLQRRKIHLRQGYLSRKVRT
jgi:hypothetical protein